DQINKKVYLAQYCALAACGARDFSKFVHRELLKKVTELLKSKKKYTAQGLAILLKETIKSEADRAENLGEGEKEAVLDMINKSGLILGTVEKIGDGPKVPKLRALYQGRILKAENYCAFGVQERAARDVLKAEHSENMSIKSGVDLVVKSIKAAFEADQQFILGGYIEVLVLGHRNFGDLLLPRGEQLLDRAITLFRLEKLPECGVQVTQREEVPKKKRRKLILPSADIPSEDES
ncbi:hypothetical protein MKW98_010623, partial [Papaver atlanticum]